jgi:hypothetical protein
MLAAVALAVGLLVAGPDLLWAQEGKSAPQVFLALATGAQETPSVDTPAVGFARFSLTAEGKLNYEVTVTGLKGAPTAMHLHRARAGQPGDVVYPLATPSPSAATTGSVEFKQEDLADLMTQGLYLNIHTDAFPAGEIRGQVVPSPPGLQVSIVNP